MIEIVKGAFARYAQALAGAAGIAGVAVTSVSSVSPVDHTAAYIGAVSTFFAFLLHRNLAMRDVQRVVRDVVKDEVTRALSVHEDHCKWVVRPTKINPPSGG